LTLDLSRPSERLCAPSGNPPRPFPLFGCPWAGGSCEPRAQFFHSKSRLAEACRVSLLHRCPWGRVPRRGGHVGEVQWEGLAAGLWCSSTISCRSGDRPDGERLRLGGGGVCRSEGSVCCLVLINSDCSLVPRFWVKIVRSSSSHCCYCVGDCGV